MRWVCFGIALLCILSAGATADDYASLAGISLGAPLEQYIDPAKMFANGLEPARVGGKILTATVSLKELDFKQPALQQAIDAARKKDDDTSTLTVEIDSSGQIYRVELQLYPEDFDLEAIAKGFFTYCAQLEPEGVRVISPERAIEWFEADDRFGNRLSFSIGEWSPRRNLYVDIIAPDETPDDASDEVMAPQFAMPLGAGGQRPPPPPAVSAVDQEGDRGANPLDSQDVMDHAPVQLKDLNLGPYRLGERIDKYLSKQQMVESITRQSNGDPNSIFYSSEYRVINVFPSANETNYGDLIYELTVEDDVITSIWIRSPCWNNLSTISIFIYNWIVEHNQTFIVDEDRKPWGGYLYLEPGVFIDVGLGSPSCSLSIRLWPDPERSFWKQRF